MEKCVEFPERLSTIYESPSPPPSFSDDHEDKLVVYDFTRKNVDNEQKSAPSHIQTMKLIHSSSSSLSDFISPISLMKSSTFYRCSSSHCTFVRLFSVSSTSKVDTRLFIEFLFVLVVVLVVRHSSSKHSIAYSLSDRFRSGIDQEETRRHRKSSEWNDERSEWRQNLIGMCLACWTSVRLEEGERENHQSTTSSFGKKEKRTWWSIRRERKQPSSVLAGNRTCPDRRGTWISLRRDSPCQRTRSRQDPTTSRTSASSHPTNDRREESRPTEDRRQWTTTDWTSIGLGRTEMRCSPVRWEDCQVRWNRACPGVPHPCLERNNRSVRCNGPSKISTFNWWN